MYVSGYTDIDIPDVTVTELAFAGLVGREGEPALIEGSTGRVITGGEFRTMVERLAGGLTARGIGPGHVVAIHAPNVPEWCLVFHAVLWAGGTVTTLNPSYTADEVRHQLVDAGAELLVTMPALLETAPRRRRGNGRARDCGHRRSRRRHVA